MPIQYTPIAYCPEEVSQCKNQATAHPHTWMRESKLVLIPVSPRNTINERTHTRAKQNTVGKHYDYCYYCNFLKLKTKRQIEVELKYLKQFIQTQIVR